MTSGAHITLESRSARTLSLESNSASVSASLTMTGRPVSSTFRTMLSLIAPFVSAMASRRSLRAARMTGASRIHRALRRRIDRLSIGRVRIVVEEDQPLLGARDLDHRVEHRLEQVDRSGHRHQLFAELVELAQSRELLPRDLKLSLADRRSAGAGA